MTSAQNARSHAYRWHNPRFEKLRDPLYKALSCCTLSHFPRSNLLNTLILLYRQSICASLCLLSARSLQLLCLLKKVCPSRHIPRVPEIPTTRVGQGSCDLAKCSKVTSKVACVLGADSKDSKKIKDCLGDEDLEKVCIPFTTIVFGRCLKLLQVCEYTDHIPLDVLKTVCKLKS